MSRWRERRGLVFRHCVTFAFPKHMWHLWAFYKQHFLPSDWRKKRLSKKKKKITSIKASDWRSRPFKMPSWCVMSPHRKSHFLGQEAHLWFVILTIYNVGDDLFCLSYQRRHQGRRLSSDKDVHATPQHWDKITPLHQVSVICVLHFIFIFALQPNFLSPLALSRLLFLVPSPSLLTFHSFCHSSLSVFLLEK